MSINHNIIILHRYLSGSAGRVLQCIYLIIYNNIWVRPPERQCTYYINIKPDLFIMLQWFALLVKT